MNQKKNRKKIRVTSSLMLLIGMTFSAMLLTGGGCSGTATKPYDRALVVTYAELTMLYEKEKMANKLTDSLYQIKVGEFFHQKGYRHETFTSVVSELSQHPEAWKLFLQDVTTVMDSLRTQSAE